MPQDDCIGTWQHGKLGTAADGDFEIKKIGGTLVGTYLPDNSPLHDLMCDGEKISFFRETATEKIIYKNGKIKKVSATKFEIKGKFAKGPKNPVNAKARTKKALPLLPDDWEADKTT